MSKLITAVAQGNGTVIVTKRFVSQAEPANAMVLDLEDCATIQKVADAEAKVDALVKVKTDADAKAKAIADAKIKEEAEAKEKADAEAKAKADAASKDETEKDKA